MEGRESGWLERPYTGLSEDERSALLAQDGFVVSSLVAVFLGANAIAFLGDALWFLPVATTVCLIGAAGMLARRRGRYRLGLGLSVAFYASMNGLMPMTLPGGGIEIFCATNLPALYTFFRPDQARLQRRVLGGVVLLYLTALTVNHAVLTPTWISPGTIEVTWWIIHIMVPLDLLGTTIQLLNNYSAQQRMLRDARDVALAMSRTKTRILNALAHELRSPLANAIGLLADLESRAEGDGVELPRRQVERVLRRTTDLLDLNHLEGEAGPPIRPAICLPAQVVQRVADRFEDDRIVVDLDAETDAPVVTAAASLDRMVDHLVDNALRHGEGRVGLRVWRDDDDLHVEVSDEGPGIPEAARDRAFAPYEALNEQPNDARSGPGVGLALCRVLAERAGGSLEVLPGSATFHLRVPYRPSTTAAPPVAEPLRLRVLLVDDERLNRTIVTRLLERMGCEVHVAEDGLLGVQRVANAEFDLVLMDVRMPNMDGLTATRAIKSFPRAPPIVALTANALAGDRERCLAAGMDGFLAKPLARQDLLAMVGQLGLDRDVVTPRG